MNHRSDRHPDRPDERCHVERPAASPAQTVEEKAKAWDEFQETEKEGGRMYDHGY